MYMQMENRLSSPRTDIEYGAVPLFNVALTGDVSGSEMAAPDDFGIIGPGLFQSVKMFLRNDQNVRGRLRADVFKSENVVVLVHLPRGNLAAKDAAEQAIRVAHGSFLPGQSSGNGSV
jgi:hypothetical protein